ncbi:hypothetical protein [Bradyrhizobium valentinum]|uniref:Uncharacterized protein n=1 Tax=Bradyrhizobium valentinum TaxID=1518501 RepID=A0A0R3L2I3_9BRAD|nr:hypothetical protein CP49_05335 [Bradyrhizobium valentinum]
MQRTMLNVMIRWCGAAGVAALPNAALATTDVALLPRNLSPWNMFVNADIVVQAVMVGLAFASLVTWTIWLAKTIEIRRKTATAKRRLSLLEMDAVLARAEQESRGGKDAVAAPMDMMPGPEMQQADASPPEPAAAEAVREQIAPTTNIVELALISRKRTDRGRNYSSQSRNQ